MHYKKFMIKIMYIHTQRSMAYFNSIQTLYEDVSYKDLKNKILITW